MLLDKLISLAGEVFKSSENNPNKWEKVKDKYSDFEEDFLKDVERRQQKVEKHLAKKMEENSKK